MHASPFLSLFQPLSHTLQDNRQLISRHFQTSMPLYVLFLSPSLSSVCWSWFSTSSCPSSPISVHWPHISTLKSAAVGEFTPWKWTNATKQGCFPPCGVIVVKYSPAHHCYLSLYLEDSSVSFKTEHFPVKLSLASTEEKREESNSSLLNIWAGCFT